MFRDDDNNIWSVCETFIKDGKKKLYRLWDVDPSTLTLVPYAEKNASVEWTVENLTRIPMDPNAAGYSQIGVWQWKETSRHLSSEYMSNLEPIEVVVVKQANSLESLINVLSRHVDYPGGDWNVLFLTNMKSEGVLCHGSLLERSEQGGGVRVKKNVRSLQRITDVVQSDILYKYNPEEHVQRSFFRRLFPLSQENVIVNLDTTIKEIVCRRCYDNMKSKDVVRIWEALQTVSIDDIYTDVARECECDVDYIRPRVDVFLESCDKSFIQDADRRILTRLFEQNDELRARLEQLAEDRWERLHEELISEAEAQLRVKRDELSSLQRQIDGFNERLHERDSESQFDNELQEELDEQFHFKRAEVEKLEARQRELSEELELYQLEIDERRRLLETLQTSDSSDDVEKETMENVDVSQEGSNVEKPEVSTVRKTSDNVLSLPVPESTPSLLVYRSRPEDVDVEQYSSYEEAVEILEGSLSDFFDFTDDFKDVDLANYFASLYFRRRSVLLAGARGEAIAEVVSAALCGFKPDVLVCEGKWNQEAVDRAFENPDTILVIKNPFNGEWLERLVAKIDSCSKTVALVCPFVEDLALEPKSLFSYVTPVVTETFLKKTKSGDKLSYGERAQNFKELNEPQKSHSLDKNVRKRLGLSPFAYERYRDVFQYFSANFTQPNTFKDKANKFAFLLWYLPLAIVLDQVEQLFSALKEDNKYAGCLDAFDYLWENDEQ